jgi:hypothetical protein
MEPSTASASQALRIWTAIKDAPLWWLVGTALALAAFVAVPAFAALVAPAVRIWIAAAAVAFGIFAACRFMSALLPEFEHEERFISHP